VDYSKLNSVTIQDAYPLPRIYESLDALAGRKFFSTLDLLSGYWHVPLSTRQGSIHHSRQALEMKGSAIQTNMGSPEAVGQAPPLPEPARNLSLKDGWLELGSGRFSYATVEPDRVPEPLPRPQAQLAPG